MIFEEQRYLHEDLERLEAAIAARFCDQPKHVRERLNQETEIAQLLDQIQRQSSALLKIYNDDEGSCSREIQEIGLGNSQFYSHLEQIQDHYSKYPNQQAESSETRYRANKTGDEPGAYIVDTLFSGEEAFGRFLDLNSSFESFSNLPTVKRLTYLQYLEVFDDFTPGSGGVKRVDKLTDQYFQYVGMLAQYLESFIRRIRPLENIDKVLSSFDQDFTVAWTNNELRTWSPIESAPSVNTQGHYCAVCEKDFKNGAVYSSHLTGRKHVKAAEQKKSIGLPGKSSDSNPSSLRLKERAIAEREYRIQRLAAAMSTQRSDTRVNVERRQGMTERERRQELESLLNLSEENPNRQEEHDNDDEDGEERIYNPLKLPLAWDGKPIPFWLYRLHGLGVEFPCEICGNFVYMGRRAFDKHFNESRHVYGLRCLGITNTALFRDIIRIDEALKLWDKIQKEKRRVKVGEGNVVQMEDAEGNVMPEKVYYDLQKQGLL